MQLHKLHEARYAGDHPVIRIIKDIIDNQDSTRNNFYEIAEKDVPYLVRTITKLYGDPYVVAQNTYHWEHRPDPRRDILYQIDIGYDDEYNPSHGIEIVRTRRNIGVVRD